MTISQWGFLDCEKYSRLFALVSRTKKGVISNYSSSSHWVASMIITRETVHLSVVFVVFFLEGHHTWITSFVLLNAKETSQTKSHVFSRCSIYAFWFSLVFEDVYFWQRIRWRQPPSDTETKHKTLATEADSVARWSDPKEKYVESFAHSNITKSSSNERGDPLEPIGSRSSMCLEHLFVG